MTADVPFPFERVEHGPMVFRVTWLEGTDDPNGVTFDVTAGAGVGNPYLILNVSTPDGKATEVCDITGPIRDRVNAIVAELKEAA